MISKKDFLEFASIITTTELGTKKIENALGGVFLRGADFSSLLNNAGKIIFSLMGQDYHNNEYYDPFCATFWQLVEEGFVHFEIKEENENLFQEVRLSSWEEFYDYWKKELETNENKCNDFTNNKL